jgi:hypothetical protein
VICLTSLQYIATSDSVYSTHTTRSSQRHNRHIGIESQHTTQSPHRYRITTHDTIATSVSNHNTRHNRHIGIELQHRHTTLGITSSYRITTHHTIATSPRQYHIATHDTICIHDIIATSTDHNIGITSPHTTQSDRIATYGTIATRHNRHIATSAHDTHSMITAQHIATMAHHNIGIESLHRHIHSAIAIHDIIATSASDRYIRHTHHTTQSNRIATHNTIVTSDLVSDCHILSTHNTIATSDSVSDCHIRYNRSIGSLHTTHT